MMNRIVGGLLLIIGTCIGGGMLALPLATAAGGFWHGLLLMVVAWFFMTVGAFYILEVTICLPAGNNLITMAKNTLGKKGRWLTWVFYLLLLYALLCAYLAGGAGIVQNLLSLVDVHLSSALNTVIFLLLLGSIVALGIHAVDWGNRVFLVSKLVVYAFLVLAVLPHVKQVNLSGGTILALQGGILPVITSFGYAIVLPSLRTYVKSNLRALRLIVCIGSFIPLVLYVLWNLSVQGSISMHHLTHVAQSKNAVGGLTRQLSVQYHSPMIAWLAHLFTAICITTAFLGVSLCMTDFLADGLSIEKKGWGKLKVVLLTFVPSLLIVIFYPGIFIKALAFAGISCIVILMLLPALMAYSSRYIKKLPSSYHFLGGKTLLVIQIIASVCLVVYGLYSL